MGVVQPRQADRDAFVAVVAQYARAQQSAPASSMSNAAGVRRAEAAQVPRCGWDAVRSSQMPRRVDPPVRCYKYWGSNGKGQAMSATKLVIVESPAKAATIEGYLGPDYHVTASIGHIRDLPQPSELPKDMKKGPFGRFAVNVDEGFTPYYVVNPDKKKKVTELKKLLKESDELFLATDEDREGEAIAWHLLQVLKPKVPVRRMVFHEITKEAIQRALENTRDLDTDLVDAQETRRILDRLYGYEVSPLLWRKIRPSLSAGRVQSVATRLVVAKERDRMAHVSAQYWSIDTAFTSAGQAFGARVSSVDGHAIATGSDFSEKGELSAKAAKAGVLHLDEATARAYAQALEDAPASVIDSVTRKPYRRRPAAPFTTSTLQQEASRKLHWNASSTMRTAQSLYESGYITYMRTDSTALSSQAIHAAREQATQLYGAEAVAESPRLYGTTSKGAQEAHEAIRPAGDHFRTPGEVAGSLSKQQLALYDLIWKRTVASQMADALGYTATIRVLTGIEVDGKRHDVLSSASGTVITSPGFRLAYQEGRDQGRYDAEKNDAEKTLPDVAEGDAATLTEATPDGHETQPPGRYTEATLVKTMEELGIGRPSTYAATIQTIGDRGYVTHRGQYLVPTWLAFSVTRLLEENLANLVDYDFTASMEGDLDRIAAGQENGTDFLTGFFFGPDGTGEHGGLRHDVASLGDDIDARAVNSIDLGRGRDAARGPLRALHGKGRRDARERAAGGRPRRADGRTHRPALRPRRRRRPRAGRRPRNRPHDHRQGRPLRPLRHRGPARADRGRRGRCEEDEEECRQASHRLAVQDHGHRHRHP